MSGTVVAIGSKSVADARTADAEPLREGGRVSLRLLSGFGVTVDGKNVTLPLVAQRLVAFLALSDRAMMRSYVAGNLWPEKPEERAAANLRSTMWRLRQHCGDLLRNTATTVRLRESVVVDLREHASLCRRALAGTLSRGELVDFDPSTFAAIGDVLPDWYDEWLVVERERMRQLHLHATDRICELLVEAGRSAAAIDVAFAAIATEPLRESSHRRLIEIHIAEGNPNEAIRQYERYRDIVREGLGLDPSPAISRLMAGLISA